MLKPILSAVQTTVTTTLDSLHKQEVHPVIGQNYPSTFINYDQAALDGLFTNPLFSNVQYTVNPDGTFNGTFDWFLFSDQDIADAITASLDGFDPMLSNANKATSITAMLRENNVLR